MSREAARVAEHSKYVSAYGRERYRMGGRRKRDAQRDLGEIKIRGAYLDVGCGRGEMLDHATLLGFHPVIGVEVVPALIDGKRVVRGEAHQLPFRDKMFDVATMLDVIEHLIPGDDEAACRELARVTRGAVLISANNLSSMQPDGTELHINRRPYAEWDALFREWFAPGHVHWIKGENRYVSEAWRIDLR